MKYVILVGDGMGDMPLSDLVFRTPLETANTPTMDSLSRNGELFRLQTIPPGMQPGSDIANLSLLGYEPQEFYTGRAPLEAASMGIELAGEETAYRCNLVSLKKSGPDSLVMIDFSAGHIPTVESNILITGLQEELGSDLFHFYPGISYRHLLVCKNNPPGLVTVPPHDYIGKNVAEYWNRYLHYPELQLLLGGDSGLRGYPLRYQSGNRRLLLTLEQRFFTNWNLFRLINVGGAVFFDAGRAWFEGGREANLPYLEDVGFGLRLSSNRSADAEMVHVDVAFPLGHASSIRGVQYLVTTKNTF